MPAGSAFVAALAVCVQRGSRTMRFEFATATRIIFGAGALRGVGLVAKEFGDRALVATGKGVDRARPLLALLEASGISSASFSISGEPIIDLVVPELSYDLPPGLTASTGLDALTQLIEPFVSSRANPMTDVLCREGMWRVARSLRLAVESGRNTVAREDMALASLYGGLALTNAGL